MKRICLVSIIPSYFYLVLTKKNIFSVISLEKINLDVYFHCVFNLKYHLS